MLQSKEKDPNIRFHAERVNRIIKEYLVESKYNIQEFETAITHLQKRIGNSKMQNY